MEKIIVSLPEKFNTIFSVIEEIKDFTALTVQELMRSLKSLKQWASPQSKKSVEAAFSSELNILNLK